jgi:hypothetical protein
VTTNIHLEQFSPLRTKWSPLCQVPPSYGKLLLNQTPGDPLSLVKKFPYFDDLIELDVLLAGSLRLGVHDTIYCLLFNAINIELCRGQVPGHV